MDICFLCNTKLNDERTQVCSAITPLCHVPYPEKIVELLGEEFVVIVTPADHMCKKCTSLLINMDKIENNLKLVRNALVSNIQKKYRLIPADNPVKLLDVVNGNLNTEEQQQHQQQQQKQQQQQQQQQQGSLKLHIYQCQHCLFQSMKIGDVRCHMRTNHFDKKGIKNEKSSSSKTKLLTQAPPLVLGTQNKRIYKCQVCSSSFDSRESCLNHIQRNHKKQKSTTGNETTMVTKPGEQNLSFYQKVKTAIENDKDKNKCTLDRGMLLNNNVPAKESAEGGHDVEEPSQGEVAPEQGDDMLEQESAQQVTDKNGLKD